MKHLKLFEQFTTEKQLEFDFDRKPESDEITMDDDAARELGTMGFPTTRTLIFESPMFVHIDYQGWFERTAHNYEIREFARQAEELGLDFSYEYEQYRNEEIDEDEFYDEAWEIVKKAGYTEPLMYAGYIDKSDFEEDIIDDFNESKLEEYCDFPGVETIRAKEVTDDGNFVVEVVALASVNVKDIIDYLNGQYADGWGEGYEQREHKSSERVSYYISTWRARDFEIKLVKVNP